MATVKANYDASGALISYKITVANGRDSTGKQIRHTKTMPVPAGMTPKKAEKEAQREAFAFEESIKQGFRLDNRQTFAEYAEYVLQLKQREGIKPKTMELYQGLLPRINTAIGHMKLADIRPQHLNAFYSNLLEPGIRLDLDRAATKIDLTSWKQKHHTSFEAIAASSGVSATTVQTAAHGGTICTSKAEAIAKAMGGSLSDFFAVKRVKGTLSNKTVLEYHRFISTVLTQAEKEMLVPFNAARKATPPKLADREPDFYQPEQINAIWDALDTEPLKWQVITHLLIVTGCRRGEIAGLKWEKIDFETHRCTIDAALLYTKKDGVYEGSTKTGKARYVILPQESIALLRKWRAAQLELRLLNGDRWIDTGYVFTQDNGNHINPDSITDWLGRFAKRHGLPHIHPHAFRHTAASTMIESGVDIVTVAGQLGHANATTTAKIYAHELERAKASASECLAEKLLRKRS